MRLVHQPLTACDSSLSEVAIRVDRRRLARRLWRAAADDGEEFGFELDSPLRHGDVVWAGGGRSYVVRQAPEPVLAIPLEVAPAAAAVVGWTVGNLHCAIEAQAARLLVPDDPGIRQSLDRLGIPYRPASDVFQPHRFTGVLPGHHHSPDHGHASDP